MTTLPPAPTSDRPAAIGRNWLLRSAPFEETAQLLPHLEPVVLEPMQVISEIGEPMRHVYFPETSIISLLSRLDDGTLVENGTVGFEGFAGLPLVLGVDWSSSLVAGQVPGLARRMDASRFTAMLPELPEFTRLAQRYVLYFLAQVAQSLACNSVHNIEQRCARWLLMTHDRMPGDDFVLTHEILAQMLAVRRAGVSVAASAMQDAKLIRYSRGKVAVIDRPGLERAACECYRIVRGHRDRLLGVLAG